MFFKCLPLFTSSQLKLESHHIQHRFSSRGKPSVDDLCVVFILSLSKWSLFQFLTFFYPFMFALCFFFFWWYQLEGCGSIHIFIYRYLRWHWYGIDAVNAGLFVICNRWNEMALTSGLMTFLITRVCLCLFCCITFTHNEGCKNPQAVIIQTLTA